MAYSHSSTFMNYAMFKSVLDYNIDWKLLPNLKLDRYISEVLDDKDILKEVNDYQTYQRELDGHDDFIRGIHVGSRVVAKILNKAYNEHSVGRKIEIVYPDLMYAHRCESCGNTVESHDNYCSHCGIRFNETVMQYVKE